jgi:hypothetical protein
MTNATEARPAGEPAAAGGTPRPGPRPSLYHRTLRVFMRSFGMLSDGIRLGYRVGFNPGRWWTTSTATRPTGSRPWAC